MDTLRRISPRYWLVPFLIFGLLAAACAQSPAAAPTQRPAPTTAPINLAPTAQRAPTAAPTTPAPTATPAPTPTKAPTTAPTGQPTPAAFALGTGHLVGDLMVNPGKFEEMVQLGTDKPRAGDEYVVVTLSLENTSRTNTLKFNPVSLQLVDTQINTDIPVAMLKSLANQLKAQDLKPGAQVQGVIAFEVAKKDVGSLELMFRGTGNQNAVWSLKSTTG